MTSSSVPIPKIIYFDTNIILQLPYWSSNVNFIELRESAQLIKAEMGSDQAKYLNKRDNPFKMNRFCGLEWQF
jgi:hypothetical protein